MFMELIPTLPNTYKELVLFSCQAMANFYDMYYAVTLNHKLVVEKDTYANF